MKWKLVNRDEEQKNHAFYFHALPNYFFIKRGNVKAMKAKVVFILSNNAVFTGKN